jgi:hypothetical protein
MTSKGDRREKTKSVFRGLGSLMVAWHAMKRAHSFHRTVRSRYPRASPEFDRDSEIEAWNIFKEGADT